MTSAGLHPAAPASAVRLVRSARISLVIAVALRSAGVAVAVAATVMLGVALADTAYPLSVPSRMGARRLAIVAALISAGTLLWRDRHVLSLSRVALWLEEQRPALDYALVTRVELELRGLAPALHSPRVSWGQLVLARGARAIVLPVLVTIIALGVGSLLPSGTIVRARAPRAGDALVRAGGVAGASRLTPLVATVTPPAYSHLVRMVVDEPATITALAGSEVMLEGRGDAAGLSARLGTLSLEASGHDRWIIHLRMPGTPAALRLRDRSFERLVALEPRIDAPPVVSLLRPDRDSVLRTPSGRLPLEAHAADDFGVANARFEVIVSSGEGETFTFRTLILGDSRRAGDSVTLLAELSLDALGLKAGDLLHIRAVARDGNDVTGPGVGTSDTRTLRIARAGEYDSVAVESAAPPPEEQSVVSQRMLILLTEALERRRPALSRRAVLDEASAISADQKRLRRSVAEVIFARLGEPAGEETREEESHGRLTPDELLKRADQATERLSGTGVLDFEGGESPVVAVNRPLLEAYRAMWDASMALDQGEPGRALPPMRVALAAIERARQAERIYLRGRPPAVVVDLARVRLAGREQVSPAARVPRSALDSAREKLERRLVRAIALLPRRPAAAVDSLLLLRIDALEGEPRFAAALGDLATALRRGRTPEVPALVGSARRALAGAPRVRDTLGSWTLVP